MEGDEMKLSCKSNNQDVNQISWFKDSNLETQFKESEIKITNLTLEDAGIYKCMISTEIDSSEATITIEVLKTTLLTDSRNEEISTTTGRNLSLSCEASVDLKLEEGLQFDWKKNQHSIEKHHLVHKVK